MVTTATHDDLALTAVGSHCVETVEPWATGPAKGHTLIDVWKKEEAMGEHREKRWRERDETREREGEHREKRWRAGGNRREKWRCKAERGEGGNRAQAFSHALKIKGPQTSHTPFPLNNSVM